jgi:hypothetical protein
MNLTDPQLTWVTILEAARDHHEAELAEIAISLYGELGEAMAEISRLRASLQSSLPRPPVRYGSQPASKADLIASTRLRAFSLVTTVVR